MFRLTATTALALMLAGPALAEGEASPEDLREINEEIADMGCQPVTEAEQETDALFELDDVVCRAAQYDIKIKKEDGKHYVFSMIYDGPLEAGEGAPTADQIAKINAMLAEMKCEMDDDDIELEDDGGFELDDVICEGGDQFDIDLDANFEITGKRAE